jgi:hypothetical protein
MHRLVPVLCRLLKLTCKPYWSTALLVSWDLFTFQARVLQLDRDIR